MATSGIVPNGDTMDLKSGASKTLKMENVSNLMQSTRVPQNFYIDSCARQRKGTP